MVKRLLPLAAAVAFLAAASPAAADDWLPHPAGASWTYSWSDSVYNPVATLEKVTVKEQKGSSFVLAWTTADLGNADGTPTSIGTVSFQESAAGLVNTDWSSTAPPPAFPILCPTATGCGNSLASTWYLLIWGTRTPVLPAPLLDGTSWASVGGVKGDVASTSDYLGTERVSVPAFPEPVLAAKVRSDVTQAGAIGDPYGSGTRTVWWVYGVGPVKVVFEHTGGAGSPVTTAVLTSTTLKAAPPPPDADYFPLRKGLKARYRWTNSRWLKKPVVQQFQVDQVANRSASVKVKSISGPIKVAGAYGFTLRANGVTNIWGTTQSASLAHMPKLGPRSLPPKKRRHFVTPYDLMTFGFNPVLPEYPATGIAWSSSTSGRDFSIYGVTGTTRVLGVRTVRVPAGKFRALVVRSVLEQRGFPFGSGVRTSWFAPGRGLVKLVFRHGDGSVSNVQLLR